MMKKLRFAIVLLIAISCDHESGPVSLKGKWKLVAQLVDPGDGSGMFINISSEKTLEFYSNATVSSNGSICSMDAGTTTKTTGTYDEQENSIIPIDCVPGNKIYYTIEGKDLILTYTCKEGCKAKYAKL